LPYEQSKLNFRSIQAHLPPSLASLQLGTGHILSHTSLQVVALSSRAPQHTTDAILNGGKGKERLSVFEVDGLKETDRGMEKAAEEVKKRFGEKGSVRMVICSAGVVSGLSVARD